MEALSIPVGDMEGAAVAEASVLGLSVGSFVTDGPVGTCEKDGAADTSGVWAAEGCVGNTHKAAIDKMVVMENFIFARLSIMNTSNEVCRHPLEGGEMEARPFLAASSPK